MSFKEREVMGEERLSLDEAASIAALKSDEFMQREKLISNKSRNENIGSSLLNFFAAFRLLLFGFCSLIAVLRFLNLS